MNELIIEPTKYSPRVNLSPAGNICIEGRSIVEDSHKFYAPILDWVKQSTCNKIKVEIKLEYINTSSSKQIFTLLSLISENSSIIDVNVDWYYEEGDDDTFELGKEFESETRMPFAFFEYSENAA
jgi:hypothetical protein